MTSQGLGTSIEVYGVRESLAVLREMEPGARAKAVAKIKKAGAPIATEAAAGYPTLPLRNWQPGGRLGWSIGAVRKGVQVQVGGRTPKGANSYALVTVVQKNAAAALEDIAGWQGGSKAKAGPRNRSTGANPPFHQLLAKYGKPATRGIGGRIYKVRELGYDAIVQALEDVAATASRKLVK